MAMIPPKGSNDRYTDEQWQAIHQSGSNLLVAASAGSGKTTVLVQRIIEKIRRNVNVDELLVVTFTEAAAKEMKDRIGMAIQDAINEAVDEEQYRHLVRQTTLLPQANISTIHAFCLRVIQRFFYVIDIDPVFRIMADTIEVEMLKEDVWEDLKEELYGETDTFFRQLARAYSNDRNDSGLQELVFSLYSFSRANPDPDVWLDRLLEIYTMEEGRLSTSPLYREVLQPAILLQLEGALYDNGQALRLVEGKAELEKHRKVLEEDRSQILQVRDAVQAEGYQSAFLRLQDFSFGRWPGKLRKKDQADLWAEEIEQMKTLRDQYKTTLTQLQADYFMRSEAEQAGVIQETRPYIAEMIRVTKRFASAYWSRKLDGNVLDFNDLEHLTLDILAPKQEGKRVLSEAGRYYRAKFQEVLIDEYQDVNKLQESILHAVTRHEPDTENLFMVGDVKQSIYAFRLADPSLFLRKYEAFGQGRQGERIILAENFRSRPEVIQFTNFVFKQLMDVSVGQMDYDEAAELKQGNLSFPDREGFETEVLLYISDDSNSGENGSVENGGDREADLDESLEIDDKITGQAMLTAQKIRELVQGGFLIYDKRLKQERPILYRDIVLLTPTKKNNLAILETMKEYDIPLVLGDSQSFFQRTEVSVMISLLKVIDNPRQDIPLAAVLRSPLVGLNERQLAMIRIAGEEGDFLDALRTFIAKYEGRQIALSGESTDCYEKVSLFRDRLSQWRTEARQNSLVNLIWEIYYDTHFLDYVAGMPAGKQRVANLHALYERAQKYEATNFKGLFQFIRFIERIQERDQDLAEPLAFSEEENAVRVMTIHASKGLEFPVVFLLDMSKRFNMRDLKGAYIFSETYGIGTDYFDIKTRRRYPSLVHTALALEKKQKLLAEEMRKLYVALTRAEQKLYLVGTYPSEEKAWGDWRPAEDATSRVLPDYLRLNANNMMRWVGLSLYRHADAENRFFPRSYRGELTNAPVSFRVHTFHPADLLQQIATVNVEEGEEETKEKILLLSSAAAPKQPKAEGDDFFPKAIDLMELEYPHQAATMTTSYQSVSEIKRLFEDPSNAQLLQLDFGQSDRVARYVEPDLPRPAFLQEEALPTNAEVGTAFHFVMQKLDLTRPITEEAVSLLLEQLVEKGMVNSNAAKRIDGKKVIAFFQTELGRQIVQDAPLVHREVPFAMLMNASKIFEGIRPDDEDYVLIHGIIDGFIEYEDHIVLFDFKTDYIGPGVEMETVATKYRGQMNLYRNALAEIKQKQVSHTYLCLLSAHQNILLP